MPSPQKPKGLRPTPAVAAGVWQGVPESPPTPWEPRERPQGPARRGVVAPFVRNGAVAQPGGPSLFAAVKSGEAQSERSEVVKLVDLLDDAISERVDSRTSQSWRPRGTPKEAEAAESFGGMGLGITTGCRSANARRLSVQGAQPEPKTDEDGQPVRRLHIPTHGLQGFKAYARSVAKEACAEVATRNPYIKALRDHRAELESPLIQEPTLEQKLSIHHDTLSLLSVVAASEPDFPRATDCSSATVEQGIHLLASPASPCHFASVDLEEVRMTDVAGAGALRGLRGARDGKGSSESPRSGQSTTCSKQLSQDQSPRVGDERASCGSDERKSSPSRGGEERRSGRQDLAQGDGAQTLEMGYMTVHQMSM